MCWQKPALWNIVDVRIKEDNDKTPLLTLVSYDFLQAGVC
jgi:hypothetical protein